MEYWSVKYHQSKQVERETTFKYFESQCSDGKKTVRLVTFEPKLRGQLDEAQKAQRRHTDNHNFYAFFFPPLEMYPDLFWACTAPSYVEDVPPNPFNTKTQ